MPRALEPLQRTGNLRLPIRETVLTVLMSTMKRASAKIIQHSEGMGTPSAEMVRQRAQELALINGHAHFSDEDWVAAKNELHGGHVFNDSNGESEIHLFVSEHDMVVGSVGRHVENISGDDSFNVVEELIAEGMDEAVHEQMLAARLADPDQEDENE